MNTAPSRPVPVPRGRPAPGDAPPRNGQPAPQARVSFGKIADGTGHRVVVFGPGGIGKTTLAATAPGPVAFFDMDDSLPRLRASFAESGLKLDVRPIDGVASWQSPASSSRTT